MEKTHATVCQCPDSRKAGFAARNLMIWCVFAVMMAVCGCSGKVPVLRQDTLSAQEHVNLGIAYEHKGDWDLALKEYDLAAQQDPKGYFYKGNLLFQQNRLADAEVAYRRALKAMPDEAYLYNNLAWLLLTSNSRLEEAEELAELAVKRSSQEQFAEFWDTLSQIRLRREQSTKQSLQASKSASGTVALPEKQAVAAKSDSAENARVSPAALNSLAATIEKAAPIAAETPKTSNTAKKETSKGKKAVSAKKTTESTKKRVTDKSDSKMSKSGKKHSTGKLATTSGTQKNSAAVKTNNKTSVEKSSAAGRSATQ